MSDKANIDYMRRAGKVRLPWAYALPRKTAVQEPHDLDELTQWLAADESAMCYVGFLTMVRDNLRDKRRDNWQHGFAVGPFLHRSRYRLARNVPVILVANYRRPYWHLLRMGMILAPAYVEYNVFPDVHIVRSDVLGFRYRRPVVYQSPTGPSSPTVLSEPTTKYRCGLPAITRGTPASM